LSPRDKNSLTIISQQTCLHFTESLSSSQYGIRIAFLLLWER